MDLIRSINSLESALARTASRSGPWDAFEGSVRKGSGSLSVCLVFRGDRGLVTAAGRPFAPARAQELSRRLQGRPEPWIFREGGRWSGFWPLVSEGRCVGCLAATAAGKGWDGPGRSFLSWAAGRSVLHWEMGRLREALERSEGRSSAGFLSLALAHEIRNPLAAMGALVQLLPLRKGEEAFLSSFQRVMEREIGRLSSLTDRFLSWAKGPTGTIERFEAGQLLEEVSRLLAPLFAAKKVRWTFRAAPGLFLSGDRARIAALVLNLAKNAYEAAAPGGKVSVRAGAKGGRLSLEIEDDGPGVPPEDRERIFEPYFSSKEGGAGLGLSLCRKIVQDHGGTLVLGRSKGKGALFTVRLPLSRAKKGKKEISLREEAS